MEDQIDLNPDIEILIQEKMFEPVQVYNLFQNVFAKQDFLMDITNIFDSSEFQLYYQHGEKKYDSRVHIEKMDEEIKEFLQSRNLIDKKPQVGQWCNFERRAALLYMATLAKHAALLKKGYTPSTADKRYLEFLYRKNLNSEGICSTILLSELPVPKENVSIRQIIDFKDKHRLELDNLQSLIINFESKIKAANSVGSINEIANEFGANISHGIRQLEENGRRSQLELGIGSLTTFLETKPTVWDGTIIAAALGAGVICPPAFLLPAIYGVIRVGGYVIAKRNENYIKRQEDPISFLYNAKKEGLI